MTTITDRANEYLKRVDDEGVLPIYSDGLIRELAAELAAAQKDAERYRWLCADVSTMSEHYEVRERLLRSMSIRGKGAIDAIIDAALAKERI